MAELSSAAGIIAIAAAVVATAALALACVLAVRLRTLRRDQQVILGHGEPGDLLADSALLRREFADLAVYVEQSTSNVDGRLAAVEHRLSGAIVRHGLVRYDAYRELSGRQSLSLALLDSEASGLVISAIVHRDSARVYSKRLRAGVPDVELSPEELDAVTAAEVGPLGGSTDVAEGTADG